MAFLFISFRRIIYTKILGYEPQANNLLWSRPPPVAEKGRRKRGRGRNLWFRAPQPVRSLLILHSFATQTGGLFIYFASGKIDIAIRVMSPRANNSKVASKASGRAVVNDSPVDCQSREVTEGKFSAENLSRPCGSNPLSATKILVSARLQGFFLY